MSDGTVKYDGFVAKILSERKVVLNQGSSDGISEGDRFVVFSLGGEVHDPETNESLGMLEDVKGKGEVIHVQDHMCTVQTYEFDMVPISESPVVTAQVTHALFPTEKKERVYRTFVGVRRGNYARKIRKK